MVVPQVNDLLPEEIETRLGALCMIPIPYEWLGKGRTEALIVGARKTPSGGVWLLFSHELYKARKGHDGKMACRYGGPIKGCSWGHIRRPSRDITVLAAPATRKRPIQLTFDFGG